MGITLFSIYGNPLLLTGSCIVSIYSLHLTLEAAVPSICTIPWVTKDGSPCENIVLYLKSKIWTVIVTILHELPMNAYE